MIRAKSGTSAFDRMLDDASFSQKGPLLGAVQQLGARFSAPSIQHTQTEAALPPDASPTASPGASRRCASYAEAISNLEVETEIAIPRREASRYDDLQAESEGTAANVAHAAPAGGGNRAVPGPKGQTPPEKEKEAAPTADDVGIGPQKVRLEL